MSLHLVPRALRYVEAVAVQGSIQGAARSLGISASAIDRQIMALEGLCLTPLFERMPRGMRPTAAGEAVLVLARRWRADADSLDTSLKEMRGLEFGTVRLAAMDSLANSVLPELVVSMRRDHPRIHLDVEILTPDDAKRALDGGAVELVMASNLPGDRNQHHAWSAELPFGCVVAPGHPLAGAGRTTLKQVAEHPLVAQGARLPVRQYLDREFRWLFEGNEPLLVTNSLQLMKQAVLQGSLAMITSELDVLRELEAGTLVFVPLDDRKLRAQTITLAINAARPLSRAARIVTETLERATERRLASVRPRAERR